MNKNKDNKKQLSENFIALFLLMLEHEDNQEFKKLLIMYKQNREELKGDIAKIYLKYIKNNELNMTYRDINREVKKLEGKLKTIGNDLKKQEDILLTSLLYQVYKNTYYKSKDIISQYKNYIDNNKVDDKTIDKTVNKKIEGKTNKQRNKNNKEKFINKLKRDIKKDLKGKKSIEIINETIDKDFNSSVNNDSDRLINNEIARVFTGAVVESYVVMNINKVEWVSACEKNTCSQCDGLDGETFDISEAPRPILDTHVNCKCILVPVI